MILIPIVLSLVAVFFSFQFGVKVGAKQGFKFGIQTYEKQIMNELAKVGIQDEPKKPEVWN